MSDKRNVVLYLDKDSVEKTRNLGFNLSKTFENHLKQLLTQFSQVNPVNNSESTGNKYCGGPDRTRTGDLLHVKQNSTLALNVDSTHTKLLAKFKEFSFIDMQKSKRTTYEKIWYVRRFLEWFKKPIETATRDDIREYLKTLNGSSTATYKNCLGALKTFVRDFLQTPNVVEGFRFPKQQFMPEEIPTKTDLQKFYKGIQSLKEKALFLVYASSGLRRNEVLALTLEDVDFAKRMIRPKAHAGDTKKAWVSFYNKECEEALRQYVETRSDNNPRLFPIARKVERKLWRQVKDTTGLDITPQDLRMWFCKEMGRLGVQDRYIDAFCGRIPKSVLARHYSGYAVDKLKGVYDDANLKILSEPSSA